MANEVNDQVQWDDQVDTSSLKTKATPSIQWHDAKDTTALEDPERYALTHPESSKLPQAAKSSYEVRPVLPSGERVGSMQARADEAPGTVGEQQAIAQREAEHPLITAAVKAPAKMGAAGAEFGKKVGANIIPASDLLAEDLGLGNGHPQTEAEARVESPRLTGALEGVGETAGGLVADPTNWLLAATGAEAGPVLGKVASAVFAAKMGKDTYEGTKQLISDWDKLTPEERSAQVAKLGISGILTGITAAHVTSGAPDLIKTGAEKATDLIPAIKPDLKEVKGLLKREAMAKVVPFNERFGINKPTFKDWKNAFTPAETEEAPTAAEPLIPEKTAKSSRGKLSDLIVDEHGNVVDKTAKPAGPATREDYVQNLIEEGLTAKEPAQPRIELPTEEAKPETQGRVESGVSPPAIPNEPSAAHPAEVIPEAKTTAKTPEAKPFDLSKPVEKPVGLRKEGAELSPESLDVQPAVRQKVFELGNEDLDKLARAHGIDSSDPQYSRAKEMRSEGRHQTGRQKLADDIVATMGDAEMQNLGRSAEGLADNPDMAGKAIKDRAKSIFPRLRGEVDEAGNPTGLQGTSPRDLNQRLGFGERNTGVTAADKDASIKSFNDKATRSSTGIDPTMLVDAAKVAAYYFEGGLREFGAFSTQMIAKLGEAIRSHLEELYARAKAGIAPTWKGTAEEWTTKRAGIDARVARAKGLPEGAKLPEAMGGPKHEGLQEKQWLAGGTGPDFAGETTPSKLERYTDPNGQFYKTVLKELRKTTTPDAASDLAQDVMADFTANVKEGTFKLPENTSEEGRVTNQLKSIAHNKAVDWVDKVQGVTASGAPRKLIETKRLSETAGGPATISTGEEEEVTPKVTEESKSPYGFGEEPSYRDEHSNARHALDAYLKEHPETAAQDKELLMAASKKSLEKADAARSKSYDTEFARSGDVDKAVEAGRKAEARVNNNKFNSTERYFGLTDAELTKLGQSAHMTGPKFRARLTAIMDDLNARAEKGPSDQPRTGPAPYTGRNADYTVNEGPTRSAFPRITTEEAPTAAKPTETHGNAEGFARGTEKSDLIPQLEHAPSRQMVERFGAGARQPHSEAWRLPKEPAYDKGGLGAGQTTPLTEPLPSGKPLIEPEQQSVRGGREGITPIDLEGAAANRERLTNLRVAEAEQALSEATTTAEQKRARAELEDAKDRRNYSKAVKHPISGGSQGADIHAIASNYLNAIEAGRTAPIPDLVALGEEKLSPNASGESSASKEAINRTASQKRQGIKTIRIDTRSGKETLIPTVDAADTTAKPYEQIVQRKPDGSEAVMDTGVKAHRRGMSKINLQ